MGFLNWLFRERNLLNAMYPEKKIKLHGIRFTIRKLNPIDHLSGANALLKKHDVYQKGTLAEPMLNDGMIEKYKTHYRHVFLAGVVSVRCNGFELKPTVKEVLPEEKNKKIPIDYLMTDWDLAEALYTEIMFFTYGKKKVRSLISQRKS